MIIMLQNIYCKKQNIRFKGFHEKYKNSPFILIVRGGLND